jgi:hypothetical protein
MTQDRIRIPLVLEGPASMTASVLDEMLELAKRKCGDAVTLTAKPTKGARVKAPVRQMHRAPIWPERAG